MEYEVYLDNNQCQRLADLRDFLAIPSISALTTHRSHMRAAACWLADRIQRAGIKQAKVINTTGNPLVYAEWLEKPGAPTILIYGHYDVQPVDPLEKWISPPFALHQRQDRLYARGISDDKGQILLHIQALEALLRTNGSLPVNIKLLFEGEEEIGSSSLIAYVAEQSTALAADAVVVSDTTMQEHNLPTICCGLRGTVGLEITVQGPDSDLHSGVYGGIIANPLHVLAELLAGLRIEQGRISVPGFYDDVVELSSAQRTQLSQPLSEEDWQKQVGVSKLAGEKEYTAQERLTIRPTLEVNGVWGGYQGEGSKTVIPATAHAKITCRLVPNQDPKRIAQLVSDDLHRRCHPGASIVVKVDSQNNSYPWTCDPNHPLLQTAAQALQTAFGRKAVFNRMGGSLPIVNAFSRELNAPVAMIGFAPPDGNIHAPNENIHIDTYELGLRAVCHLWHELAKQPNLQ